MILPMVDDIDVYHLQQVCRLFHHRIKDDSICQRRLFLSPSGPVVDNAVERTTTLDTDTTNLRFNPFLTRMSITPFIDWSNFISRMQSADSPQPVPRIQEWNTINHHLCLYPLTNSHESWWNNMFVTQPPITSAAMMLPQRGNYSDNATSYPQDFSVCNPNGLKIGDIVREWKKITYGNEYLSGAPFCIVLYAFASYERFYSNYRKVLLEYQNTCRK